MIVRVGMLAYDDVDVAGIFPNGVPDVGKHLLLEFGVVLRRENLEPLVIVVKGLQLQVIHDAPFIDQSVLVKTRLKPQHSAVGLVPFCDIENILTREAQLLTQFFRNGIAAPGQGQNVMSIAQMQVGFRGVHFLVLLNGRATATIAQRFDGRRATRESELDDLASPVEYDASVLMDWTR